MTIRAEILKSASGVQQLAATVRQMIGAPAFDALPRAEQALVIEELQLLLMLEGVYLSRAELHAEPELGTDARRAAGEEHERELREARERTYRASNLCPDCKGVGNRYSITLADDVPREVFSEGTGACRRCGGSGRYVRLGVSS